MHPRRLAPLAALPLVVMTASPAHAAPTVFYNSGNYSYAGDGTNEVVSVVCAAGFVLPASSPDPAPCAAVTSLTVDPSNGTDQVSLAGLTAGSFPQLGSTTINSVDFEADTITGSLLRDVVTADDMDTVVGGAGNDLFAGGLRVDGGEGNDTFDGVYGAQGAFGGAGDDVFQNSITPINGGSGEDSLELDFHLALAEANITVTATAATLGFVASLGNQTQDVSVPLSDVEHLYLTFPDLGTQTFNGATFPGSVVVRGYAGPDTLIGTKQPDVLRGGAGDDVIDAQDGAIDIVDCGSGNDSAKVDVADTVSGCEAVSYPNPETSAIKGPKKVRKGTVATFRFSSPVVGATFQCKVDKKAWKACKSPYAVKTAKLKAGRHTLQVRAVYPAGNPDVTPSKKRFKLI